MNEVQISQRQSGDVTILDVDGNITFGEGTTTLRTEIRRVINDGRPEIVLNLAQVRYVDSSGLGEMVSGFMAAQRDGGYLKLMNVSPNVRDLLEVTKLVSVFDVYPARAEAVMR
jgi:anti-sigma B factor antagonist